MAKKETSPHKIEANRGNAKKSTGPRTAVGKAKSSRNAVKHGLLAGRIVLADHADEDPQQFGLLLDGLVDDYQPQGTIETMLVERLAASFWRLRRAYRFEVESIMQANRPNPLADALKELSPLPPPRTGRVHSAFAAQSGPADPLRDNDRSRIAAHHAAARVAAATPQVRSIAATTGGATRASVLAHATRPQRTTVSRGGSAAP